MKFVRFAALLLAAALGWSAPAAAQADTTEVWWALAPVCPGAQVRLSLVSVDSVRGACGRVDSGRLLVRQGRDEREVALAQIDSVWVRTAGCARASRSGALIGALAVGGAFAFVSNGLCEAASGCRNGTVLAGGLGALLGYLSGAFFGALLGPGETVWDRRYPL